MALAKTLVALGNWIESHFPEKVTAAEIETRILTIEGQLGVSGSVGVQHQELIAGLQARVAELERKAELTTSEMNKTKIMLLTQRQTAGR
jgi:hypothetical protein